jgi:hypothetical protein
MTRITMADRPPLRSVGANCRIRLAIGLRTDRSSEGYSNARQVGKALNLVVNIDTVLSDPRAAAYEIADYLQAIDQLTVTRLRNVIGSMDLEQTLTSREEINTRLRIVLDEATGKWGIRVNRVEIKAIDPPLTIKEVLQVVWHQFGRRPVGAACVPFLLVACPGPAVTSGPTGTAPPHGTWTYHHKLAAGHRRCSAGISVDRGGCHDSTHRCRL